MLYYTVSWEPTDRRTDGTGEDTAKLQLTSPSSRVPDSKGTQYSPTAPRAFSRVMHTTNTKRASTIATVSATPCYIELLNQCAPLI